MGNDSEPIVVGFVLLPSFPHFGHQFHVIRSDVADD